IPTDSNQSKKKIKLRNKISKKKLHFLKISSESSADETNNDNNIDENFECNSNKDEKRKVNIIDTKLENNILRSLRPRVNKGYHLKADEYFTTQSEKSVTSNHTLNRLRNRHLDEETLQQLLANDSYISKTHKKKIEIISESLILCYKEWLYIMEEGYTVLLFGLGSKRLLINNFRKEVIFNEPTLVINGFFPSLTIKDILDNIIVELLGLNTVTNQNECYDIIEKTMKTHPDDCIYLLIHNIDCGMLRLNKAQDMLSRLANIPNIHMLASVDHINAPLLWDNVKRARYNFYWMDVTTFLPYQAEISYESSLLVQKSGVLALLSLENVFASLTSNAKAIYIILVKYQLEHNGNNYSGMAFKDLYMSSREAFLVSSDQALRAQLTEFIDHKLVKTKRQVDGIEYLIIPLDDALLKQFLEQQNDME
ncbi:PREDICTED: origin recognition complex subunit 2, partial [Ceratosolen solmsi marchali]|uniref:Origin recognition complex subunit 2 n=1 Tax=Ceratosolen solmsi marchali TaxID=326594 RepID=A0AAJ6YHK4_9HYME